MASKNLEQNLKECVEKTMNASGDVKGLVVCNDEGYLYSASGTMNEGSAAVISQLSLLVGQLETNEEDPVITLVGKESKILIHRRSDVIVALHKAIPSEKSNNS